jgi:hypothetical protein
MEKPVTREPRGANPTPGSERVRDEAGANDRTSVVRIASDEQFRKAHRKTSTLHAGLFRRLAE